MKSTVIPLGKPVIFCASLLILNVAAFGQPLEGKAEKDTTRNRENVFNEDLEGRAKSWQEQRAYPGEQIPVGAREDALEQKNRMGRGGIAKDKEIGEDIRGRDNYWHQQRAIPADSIPYGAREKAINHKLKMRGARPDTLERREHHSPPVSGVCNWASFGPRNINGRIRSLAIHPTNGNIVYAGAAEGGVWKTTDSGQSWYPLMQYEQSIAIGALAVDPVNPDIIYAGTGEPTYWPGYEGVGVYKSIDGGTTWNITGNIGNGYIARLTIDPNNTSIVYCAGFTGGLYKSTNGGTSWSQIRAGDVTDFALNPNYSDSLYCGVRNDGVYLSTDGGAGWSKLSGGLPATMSNRVILSVCDASPENVYAKLDQTVYKSTDGGSSWTAHGNHGSWTFGYWCNYIAVDPTDPDIVFAAGSALDRSTDGGTIWSSVLGGSDWEKDRLHPDQHAMVFDPTNHLKIYASNDGGVYLSDDGAASWNKVSDGLIVTQFYDVGNSTATPTMAGGGTQDQGTNVTVGGLTWNYLFDADGGFMVFHPSDPYIMYGEIQYNSIRKSTNGGANWTSVNSGLTGSGPWIGAIVMDETCPETLFTGRQEVFRTINGATSWSASSPTVGGNVSAIAVAPSNNLRIYAGSSSGNIWKSTDGGGTLGNWSDLTSAPLPNRFLSDIAIDRTDPDIVYLTFSGFDINTPGSPGHVFRSTDGGTIWNNISGASGNPNSLPDIPTNAIEIDSYDSSILYVGTDIGIFRTTNTGVNWTVFEAGFPQVVVVDLKFDDGRDLLIAATHGRGMWQYKVGPTPGCSNVDIYLRDHFLDTGELIPSASGVVDPLSVVRGGSMGDKAYRWQCADIKVDAQPYYTPDVLFDGVEFDRDLEHDKPIRTQVNHVYVQVHNRGPFNATNVNVKILWASASAGLPALPSDFWTNFPNDPGITTDWHPIGTYQTIPVLEPTRPVVLSWNWTPPMSAPIHSCIIAVIDSPSDPIPPSSKVINIGWLIGNEKRFSLKNLHVVDPPPGPAPFSVAEIYFNNDLRKKSTFDFIIDRESFPINGKLDFKFSRLKTMRPLEQSLKGIEITEKRGCWLMRILARVFPFINVPPPVLQVGKADVAVISGVILKPGEQVSAKIEIYTPRDTKPGDRFHFTVLQKCGEEVIGGSTYEIRIREE